MNVITCSVDGCDNEAACDVWLDDDGREFLCRWHGLESRANEWITFEVRGRTLLKDTVGTWGFLPERDERLHELAKKAGLA